uniref:DUF4249 family protein n=1 Tax=candidate division WOR-3 bacterium TaxID=2052148 RepID=A0A7C6EDG4_UNCW3
MKQIRVLAILFWTVWLMQCEKEIESIVVTAQVTKTLAPESNTATVILGRTKFHNVFLEQPSDTSFTNIFPVTVQPITGAAVKINEISLREKIDGVYFKPALDLQYMQRYDLHITTDKETITGNCVLPDSFSIIYPNAGDTLIFFSARVVWSKSDSAEHYIIGVQPVDTLNKAQGWNKDFSADSISCVIPQEAFIDTMGNFYPGEYSISLMAINGAWKLSEVGGGNLTGAQGIFGAAVYAQPIVVNIKSP